MNGKSVIISFFLVSIGCLFDAYANNETIIIPQRCATPSSPEKYCKDILKQAILSDGELLYIDFGPCLTTMLQSIAHNPGKQAHWGEQLAKLIVQINLVKRVTGVSVQAWSLNNLPAISPMIHAAIIDSKIPAEKLRVDYWRPSSPDFVSMNKSE